MLNSRGSPWSVRWYPVQDAKLLSKKAEIEGVSFKSYVRAYIDDGLRMCGMILVIHCFLIHPESYQKIFTSDLLFSTQTKRRKSLCLQSPVRETFQCIWPLSESWAL
jgi:hypothetical protein